MENRRQKEAEIKVKVYSRSQDGKWEDRGIGHVAVDYMEKSDDPALFVYEQDSNETILVHRISPDDIYRKQEDTIISWRDPLYSTELAVSFREVAGCSYIWDHICNVQRNSNFGTFNDDTFHGFNSDLRELPTVALSTLPLILKIVVESGITDQIRVVELILRDQEFFQKLMDLFRICEDLEDLDSLNIIYKIVKGIIMLNSPQIFEKIFGDEFIMDIIGCLEYDPEVSHVRHRDFLEQHVVFKEAIPIKDPVVLSKIHQTYRVGYLKDVVLPRVLDDATAASLNSIVHANNGVVISLLREDSTFIRELFSRLRSSGTPADSRKNLPLVDAKITMLGSLLYLICLGKEYGIAAVILKVHFLLEFCTLSKSLQTVQQHQLFRDLANEGLFDIISDILQKEDKRLILAGTDILMLSLNQDPNLLRSYVVQPEGNQLLGHLVQGMLTDFGDDMHCQFLEILRTLLDAYSVSGSQRDAIIEIFYERHLGQLIDVITSSCPGVSDSLAEPAAADSVKHSNTKPEILLNICELLCFCVLHHPYRIKCYFLLNNLMDKVLLLTRRKEKYLAVSAVRFIRTVISRNDESLNNYVAKRNLLKPIVDAFVANGDRCNLLNSAVLDLFEFIRKENLKPLLKYLVESSWCQLSKFECLPSIHSLKVKYEQSLESAGTKPVVNVDSRKHVEKRALEKEEEDYFNEDSDEEVAASVAAPNTQRMKANPSSFDESSARSPTLSSRPGGLVDYDDDEDDEGYKPPPKRQTDASQEDEDALESLCVKGKLASKDLGVAKKQRLDRSSKSKDSMFAALCSTLSQTVLPNKKVTSIIQNASPTSIMKTSMDKDNHQTEKVEVVRSQYDENCSDEQNGGEKVVTSQSRSDDTLSKTQENGS